jgi:hypothetical protein
MQKQLMALALGLSMVGFNGGAQASLISLDSSFGADTITYDTATGLEWLDLTVSTNQSYNDVIGLLGGTYVGFRYASTSEVEGLFDDVGIVGNFGNIIDASALAAEALLSQWGMTSVNSPTFMQSFFFTGDVGSSSGTRKTGLLEVDHNRGSWQALGDSYDLIESASNDSYGSALVRVHQTVPEPGVLALVGLGLAGLAMTRRRARV